MELESISEEEMLSLASWAQENSLWNGREVSLEEQSDFSDELEAKIQFLITSDVIPEVDQRILLAKFASLGIEDPELLKEIQQELGITPNGVIIQAGFGKSVSKFWKKHKVEILVGVAVVAIITTVAVIAISTAGAGTGPAIAAGASALESKREHDKQNSAQSFRQDLPSSSPIALSQEDLIATSKPTLIEPLQFNDISRPREENSLGSIPKNPFFSQSAPPTNPSLNFDLPQTDYQKVPEKRDYPVFSSSSLPQTKSWPTWIMESIGLREDEKLPSLPQFNTSMNFVTEGEVSSRRLQISGVNGAATTLDRAISNAEHISKLADNHKINWTYNCSNTPVLDLAEAATINMAGYSPNTRDLIRERLIDYHNKNIDDPQAKCLEICHSQGALHLRNALQSLPKEIQERVIVVAIAPAGVITDQECFQAFNYASKNDIVPQIEPMLKEMTKDLNECYLAAAEEARRRQEHLIYVKSVPNKKLSDHDFQNPIFLELIRARIAKYYEEYGEKQ